MADAPTANMGMVLPTQDSSVDAGDWDRLLTIALGTVIDQHTHAPGSGARVPTSGLLINAALEFNANRATELTGLAMQNLSLILASGTLEVFSFAGNLYWRNGSGQNVRITSGSTLDVASVGGIAGDYASIGAEFAYVDASDTYTAKQQLASAVRQWARIAAADLDIYEYKAAGDVTAITNRVRLSSPAALAASYALTFPAALPGSTQLVQMSSAGALTASNTVGNAVAIANFSGAVAFAGLITASAGLTAAANQHVTVSGTGKFKYPDVTVNLAASAGQVPHNVANSWDFADTYWYGPGLALQYVYFPINVPVGARIKGFGAFIHDTAGGHAMSLVLIKLDVATGIPATLITGGNSAGDGTAQTMTQGSATETVSATHLYMIGVSNADATVTNHAIYGAYYIYDQP